MDETALVVAWWQIFKNQRLTVKSVVITAIEGGNDTMALRNALNAIAPPTYPGSPCSPHRLGKWLSRMNGRKFKIEDRYYAFADINNSGGRTWQLRSYSPSPEEAILPDGYTEDIYA